MFSILENTKSISKKHSFLRRILKILLISFAISMYKKYTVKEKLPKELYNLKAAKDIAGKFFILIKLNKIYNSLQL